LHGAVYTISHVFLGGGKWGGGGNETLTKFAKSFAKVWPKFWQNFMSSKFQKNHNTNYIVPYYRYIFQNIIKNQLGKIKNRKQTF